MHPLLVFATEEYIFQSSALSRVGTKVGNSRVVTPVFPMYWQTPTSYCQDPLLKTQNKIRKIIRRAATYVLLLILQPARS